jgi:hypothetical protein
LIDYASAGYGGERLIHRVFPQVMVFERRLLLELLVA